MRPQHLGGRRTAGKPGEDKGLPGPLVTSVSFLLQIMRPLSPTWYSTNQWEVRLWHRHPIPCCLHCLLVFQGLTLKDCPMGDVDDIVSLLSCNPTAGEDDHSVLRGWPGGSGKPSGLIMLANAAHWSWFSQTIDP